jgi:hypothetical protein
MNTTSVSVYSVKVTDRMDGLYLFSNEADAESFAQAVHDNGGEAFVAVEPINLSARDLIQAEFDMNE